MKLCLIQKDINNIDYLSFLEDVVELHPDWVIFGELGMTGCLYDGGEPIDPADLIKQCQTFPYAISIGLPRLVEGSLRNSYLYCYRGETIFYDKINLFPPMNEVQVYQPGITPCVIETPWGKVGVAICYDLRFPQLFQELKEMGAELIIVPAAFPQVRIVAWRDLLIERARETHLPVVGINAVGDDGTNIFGGTTMVVAADGTVIARADEINESIIEVEL